MALHPGPEFSVADVYRGWVRALGRLLPKGSLVDFNLNDRLSFYSRAGTCDGGEFVRMVDDEGAVRLASKGLEAACYEFLPDVMLVVSCFYLPPELLDLVRARGTKVVILHTEEPYEHDRQFARGLHADLNLLNDPTHLERWLTIGPAEYMPHAYDPEIHCPGKPREECRSDFAFVGTGYPGRVEFLERVDWTGIDAALAGNWQHLTMESPLIKFLAHDQAMCCDNTEAVDLYRATKVSANLYRDHTASERPDLAAGYSMGPREVELAATGCFYLTEPRAENRDVLGVVPTFESPAELGDKIRYYMAHEAERETIAAHARKAIEGRTFDANARRFLTLAERL